MSLTVVFIEEQVTGHGRIELRDLKTFREPLDPDVVNAFCCCFVHADRLVSLTGFASSVISISGSRGFQRDLQTIVWLAVGTPRELALAIRRLLSALAKRGALDPDSSTWVSLRQLEERWENDPFLRDMRNVAAFHVNPDVVGKGLVNMEATGTAILIEGQGPKLNQTSLRVGLEALLNGCGKDLNDFDRFTKVIGEDRDISSVIQETSCRFLTGMVFLSSVEVAPNEALQAMAKSAPRPSRWCWCSSR